MRRMLNPINAMAIAALFAVLAAGLAACDNPHSVLPTSLPPPPPPATPGPATGPPLPAKSIQIGEVVTGQLQSSDNDCLDLLDPMDTWTDLLPCQEYRVSVPTVGNLSTHLTWDTAAGQLCIAWHTASFPNLDRQCRSVSPLDVSTQVPAGTYAFGVEFKADAVGSKTFSLTTSFSAGAAAARR